MRSIGILTLSLLVFFSGTGCDGPLVMIPGGVLSGDVQPTPSDWSFSDDVRDVQLETRPDDPYSVNVWGIGIGERFMVASGRGLEATWAQHIQADPRVRLRIEDSVYELSARLSQDPRDRDLFLEAARAKYDFEPEAEDAEKAVLFVLEPR